MELSSPKTIGRTASDNALQLKQAIDLVWKSAPGWTLAGITLIILPGSLPLAVLYLMKLIVDSVSSGAGFEAILLWIGLAERCGPAGGHLQLSLERRQRSPICG